MLDAFDQTWAAYLQRFVAWKFADAAALESELIKVAIEMEASVLSKTGGDTSPDTERSEDLQVGSHCLCKFAWQVMSTRHLKTLHQQCLCGGCSVELACQEGIVFACMAACVHAYCMLFNAAVGSTELTHGAAYMLHVPVPLSTPMLMSIKPSCS